MNKASVLFVIFSSALFGGIIKAPPFCNTPVVEQELKDIVKRETGLIVKDLRIGTKGPSIGYDGQICQCSLTNDGKDYHRYAYVVSPIEKAWAGLDKPTIAKYKSMTADERKNYVRVEFLQELKTVK